MTPERWKIIEELFHNSLEREVGERAAFLDSACDGDQDLRRQVEALIASSEEAGDFMEESPLAGALSLTAGELPVSGNSSPPLIGQMVGHYEIQSFIGAGGMGEVYLARDLKLDRPVALKILPAKFTGDAAQVHRFEREARAASALNHPNIVTIHEIGREGDAHFIATEFIEGQTLREKIAGGKISFEEAVSVSIQIATALAAAHAAGIVHRDIKPENVMARPDGLVKVLDFGLAKPAAREPLPSSAPLPARLTTRTDPGMLMGTIGYLSPEQVRRQEVDHRTDLFSLGVVLYEMVTGIRPFTGSSVAAVCDSILRDDPLIERADTPPSLREIISRAIEKDCAARYQTADEMRGDLERLVREANQSGPRRASGWRVKAALGAGALVVLIVILATGLRRAGDPEAPPFLAGSIKRITDTPGLEIFPSLSPDGQSIVYANRSEGTWDIYLKRLDEPGAVNLTPDDTAVDFAPAFSPDGRRIAFHSSRQGSGIFLMDTNGQNLTKISNEGHNPAWSPDGREIALAEYRIFDYEGHNGRSRLFVVNVQTRERRTLATGDAVQPDWSPGGHRIAYWGIHKGGQRDIWTVPASGGEPVAVTEDHAVDWNPVWSPDGKYIYFLSDRAGSMNLWRAPIDELSGKVLGHPEPATLPSANSQHMSFSSDGRTLVYVEMSRRENTYQIGFDPLAARVTGQATQIARGIRRYSNPDISPDEKSLVFVSTAEAQGDVFILDRDSSQLRQLTNDAAQDRNPRWSPVGGQIAFLSDRSGKYEIWKVNEDGGGLDRLTDTPGADVFNPVWSPDGRRLLYKVYDVNSFIIQPGQPALVPQPLPGEQMPGFVPWSWSPDGKRLAGWKFIPELPDLRLAIYSFDSARYDLLPHRGTSPIWLKDSRRLIYTHDLGKMYMLDIRSGEPREIHNIEPNRFGVLAISRDNRRLYYSLISDEADVYLLSLN